MNTTPLTGGCLCGAVRYRLDSRPFDAGYCHCELCRRACGAPVVAFATVPLESFVVSGSPRRRRSSAFGERWFCGDCGTQLAMHVDHQPDTVDFTLATLPIMVLTSEEGPGVEKRVLELGADDYIIKPFDPEVLLSRVHAVFRRLKAVAA